jgi:hypothetical protein
MLGVLLMVAGRKEEGKLKIGALTELQIKSERKTNSCEY